MDNRKQRGLAVLAGCLAACMGGYAAPSAAQEDDSKNPFSFTASETVMRDSNLYRLPNGVDAPKGKRSDTVSVTKIGVNFDKELSRQGFHAGVSASRSFYAIHKNLTNTGGDANAQWNWRIGDRLSGVLGYSYGESFVGFSNTYTTNSVDQKRVMRQLGRARFSLDYWWHPDWAVGLGFSDVRNDYRDKLREYDKYDAQEASVNFTYRPSTGNRIVLSFRGEEGQYSNRAKKSELAPGETSLRDWSQRDVRLSGQWKLSDVTQLNGYAGYTQRKYDLASNRDFNGLMGKIEFHWVPTGKAVIDLSWRREVGADQDAVSNYAVTQGWSLRPTWVITQKVRLGVSGEYLKRTYGGDAGQVTPGTYYHPRDAKTLSYGATLQYLPVPSASIALGYQNEKRDAKEKIYDYRAHSVFLSGSITF
ncbi:MAG: outer membrane beta-barrel protein [Azoarcus sp.]|jgi:exopolysaccharide biosynthesis operon protein EpsL|nr:outer membrane beta-barrel protein [Azoarcus sp.]